MTVTSLIGLLQKVEHKEAEVYLENSAVYTSLTDVVIEHDLISEEIVVILKKR